MGWTLSTGQYPLATAISIHARLTVRVDTTVGTVCPPTLLRGLVDLNVLDDQVAGVQTLGVGVGFSVLEQAEEELSALDGPAGLADTELLACIAPHINMYVPFFKKFPSMHPRTWLDCDIPLQAETTCYVP